MEQVEGITASLLDKKYLFNGFVQCKVEWDAATLLKVYQRLLSVHSDGFDYEEEDTQVAAASSSSTSASTSAAASASHLSHICKCLRLLGVGHLASKSQDVLDKARALRIISTLDDKISAKYKPHMAARRIRVVIKKEQKSRSHKAKPRLPCNQEDPSQYGVTPAAPVPQPCQPPQPQQNPVPKKSKVIPKVVKGKGQQHKGHGPEGTQHPLVTPGLQKDSIPSGRQLQRTPVSSEKSAAVQCDNVACDLPLPFNVRLESDTHCKAEQSNTSQIDSDVHCKDDSVGKPVCPHLDIKCHKDGTALASAVPPPLSPSHEALPPEAAGEQKPNLIPTGHQIPRTPKTASECLAGDSCPLNEETAESLAAQNACTASPGTPGACREQHHNTQDEGNDIDIRACPAAGIAPSPPAASPSEPSKIVDILSLPDLSDLSVPGDGALPLHCRLSPPSGYRDEVTPSEIHSETLAGKCLSAESETATSDFPSSDNWSPGSSCTDIKEPQEPAITRNTMATTAAHNEEIPPSGSGCGSAAPEGCNTESQPLLAESDDQTPVATTFESSSYAISDKGSFGVTFVETTTSAAVANDRTFVSNSERTFVNDKDVTFVSNNGRTLVSNDRTFVIYNDASFVTDNNGTFVSNSDRSSVSDVKCMADESDDLEKLMNDVSIQSRDSSDAASSEQHASYKQKRLVSDEETVSTLCENIELNCSLKEKTVGSEVSHLVVSPALAQNATFVLPAKKLQDSGCHKGPDMSIRDDVADTYVPKGHKTIANVQELTVDEPLQNATSRKNDSFFHEMQNEELYLTEDDDTFEIFPHKRKASRAKRDKTSSGVNINTDQKLPEKMDEGEGGCCEENKSDCSEGNEDPSNVECAVKEQVLSGNALRKSRRVKVTITEREVDSAGEKELVAHNAVVKPPVDNEKPAKRGRSKLKDKKVPDLGNEKNTTSKQRKGRGQKEVCNEIKLNEQMGTNVESVKEEAHKRICRQIKSYDENCPPTATSSDSDESWMLIGKKGAIKPKVRQKKNSKDKDKTTVDKHNKLLGEIEAVERKEVKPRGRQKKGSVESSAVNETEEKGEVGVRSKAQKGAVEGAADKGNEEKAVKPKGRPKKTREDTVKKTVKWDELPEENREKEKEEIKTKGRKKKKNVKASGSDKENNEGKMKDTDTDMKNKDAQLSTEGRRGRACKQKARTAITQLFDDSLT